MERYDCKMRLDSYTINKGLLENLAQFFTETVAHTISPELAGVKIEEHTVITLLLPGERIRFNNINTFAEYGFNNHIEGVTIELEKLVRTPTYQKAFVFQLSFGKEVADNYLHIALQDSDAGRKLVLICQKCFAKLEPFRNNHSRFYRSEALPTAFFVAGAICGTLAFAVPVPLVGVLLAVIATVGLSLFAYSVVKGYSSFELA